MQSHSSTCAACGQNVEFVTTPEDRQQCPQCGAPHLKTPPRPRFNWFLFLFVLLAPALLSALGARIRSDGLAVGGCFIGALVAGILCGVLLGRHVGRATASRIVWGIVFTVVFGAASLVLGFFGCSLGGFNLNIH